MQLGTNKILMNYGKIKGTFEAKYPRSWIESEKGRSRTARHYEMMKFYNIFSIDI